jgi:PD-(D/E)XK nuclease superfamily protein
MMLPAGLEPRAFLGADAMSFSELGTLSRCENAWVLGYGSEEREKSAPSAAMQRGTEIHRLWGALWTRGDIPETEDATAALVMDRYARYYSAGLRGSKIQCLATELPVAARFSWGSHFFGFIDGLFDVTGVEGVPDGLYVGEAKSADKLSAVTYLVQSPQTPLYVWTLRQMGYPVLGAFIDVLRTSGNEPKIETKADAYKRFRNAGLSTAAAKEASADESQRLTLGEPPLAESFDRRFLLEPELDIAGAIGQARRANGTRRVLFAGEQPLKNIGPSCSWCFAQAKCFGLEVEVADEAEEPF